MSKRIIPGSLLLTLVVSLASISIGAAAIYTSGVTPFVYEGRTYVPLKSTASFLGAPLRWDAARGRSTMTYRGEDLALTPNSAKALYKGRNTALSSPPRVVRGVTYVPVDVLKKYYNVPVEWDRARSEVRIKGPSGWRTMKASSRSPWHGGPPPWAPAWGQRGHGTPGHSSNVKASGSGKAATWGRRGNVPGHPSNAKPSGNSNSRINKKDR